jgi:hypothetical protein
MTAQVGFVKGHHDEMADADGDVLIAAGAQVRLGRLVRVDPADLDVLAQRGISAHNKQTATTRKAAATYT